MRRALWLLAGLLASAATAQVSVLSNPPGTGVGGASAWGSITGTLSSQTDLNSALAGKAKLSGGNSFSGAQAFDNTLSLTNAGTTADLHLNAASGADTLYFDFNGITYAHIGTNAALSWLVYDANVAHHFYINGADSLDLAATALDFHTGVGITNNGTSIINGSGVLQAAGFPALTGDVTTSAGSLATSIPSGTVTLAKMANMATSSLIYRKTAGSGAPEVNTLATLKTDLGLTGTNSGDQTITLTGDVTGTGTGSFATTLATVAGAIKSSGATAGIGYATGAGGAVTQLTSRTTTVVNNKACGAVTLFSAAGSATYATFTVTDSAVAATDNIIINEKSGTNLYIPLITSIGAGTFNVSFATTGGTATDAPVFNYCVVKGVAA